MRDVKTPEIASTITPPRHVMATAERGKLGRRERIALAGLAKLQGGASWQGAVIAGSSTSGYVSGDLQHIPSDSFAGERSAPTPVNPLGTTADATAGMVLAHAVTAWGAESVVWAFEAEDGRLVAARDEQDGDESLPRVTETCAAREARVKRETKQGAKSARVQAKTEGPAIAVDERPRVTKRDDDLELEIAHILRGAGHKGKITRQLRQLALDVLAQRQQTREYCG